jgi:hypothetical protein
MGRGNHLPNMNEVHVCTEAVHKDQLAIHFQHMEERFGGIAMQKREHERTQHKVPTDHLADMDGLSIHRRQPRSQNAGQETNLLLREPINALAGCKVRRKYPMAQAHAISLDASLKLDTQKEKVKNSDKKNVPREVAARRNQMDIRWWQHVDD